MVTIADLLLYKKELELRDSISGNVITKVWIRVLGDLDLTKAYRAARIASAKKREALRDELSSDYQDEVIGVAELTREEQEDLIKTSWLSNTLAEAQVAIERPDLPVVDEIAIDPDAATLEELEKLDAEEEKVEKSYQEKIQEYMENRSIEVVAKIKELSDEEVLSTARFEVSNIIPFTTFMTELNDQKAFLGTYIDKTCKVRAFETVEDFKNLPRDTKQYIIEQINHLEVSGADIKN